MGKSKDLSEPEKHWKTNADAISKTVQIAKRKKRGQRTANLNNPIVMLEKETTNIRLKEYSPAWVAAHTKDALGNKLVLIERIRDGVKKSDWKNLISYLGSTEKEFADILPVSISSMQKKSVYGKETSERIYELAKLFGLGYEVFDSKEDFKNWLMTPSRALGDKKPFELLDSSFGFEMVENEIVRIQYNVYS
jgi:putative toxin-antitoxin system antitoxin component (TIGR02293 family)